MINYLRSFDFLTEDDIARLVTVTRQKTIHKNDFFIREGEICDSVAFLKSGTFRSYYLSDTGEELTYCITFPNNFMTAYSSFITNAPTPENIQAITSADLLILPKKEIELLSSENPNWMRFLKVMAEQQYLELEKRIFELQKEKAKQRYLNLLNSHPEYVKTIPLQYLASYLGITQRHLSRLRSEIVF